MLIYTYLSMAPAIKKPPCSREYEGRSVPPPPSETRNGERVMIIFPIIPKRETRQRTVRVRSARTHSLEGTLNAQNLYTPLLVCCDTSNVTLPLASNHAVKISSAPPLTV